jgi:hypothetical protein
MPKHKIPFKRILAIFLTLFGVGGTYVSIFGFWMPRITVQPGSALDPQNASSMNFNITNQGYLTLYDVAVGCRPRNVEMRLADTGAPVLEVITMDNVFGQIGPMKSATFQCQLPSITNDLDVDFMVYYRPAFYPFSQQESFRFTSHVSTDGQVQWFPRPDADTRVFEGPAGPEPLPNSSPH